MEAKQVHVGLIEHKHGTNVYASFDENKVYGAIRDYCLDNWEQEEVPGKPGSRPKTGDVIERYFEHMLGSESYTVEPVDLL